MQQHPIPHNILDIEYKLVGNFTIKQFAFLATGFGIGGLFVYGYVSNPKAMPAWLAFPAFAIFGGLGIFMIVKIGNQTGDIFLKNFIRAIFRPTRRVWQSKNFNQKIDKVLETRKAAYKHKDIEGAGIMTTHKNNTQEYSNEELNRLSEIGKTANIINTQHSPKQTENILTINQDNIQLFTVPIQLNQEKLGSATFFVVNDKDQAIENAKIILTIGETIYYNGLSNKYGLATTGMLNPNEYIITVTHPQYKFPTFKLKTEAFKLPIIKIKAKPS